MYWYTWLSVEGSPRARSTTPACGACARASWSTRRHSTIFQRMAQRLQGCAKRSGTRGSAADAPVRFRRRGGRPGGYGAVLSEGPVRRLLFASLCGRVAFSMLPLGFVLFAIAETGSNATAGAMVAAFAARERAGPGARADRGPPRRRSRWSGSRVPARAGSPALVLAAALGAPALGAGRAERAAGARAPAAGPVHARGLGAGAARRARCSGRSRWTRRARRAR